jgi:hypothetical protein
LVSPPDKPLEQANGEDSQEEPDQEVSESGDEPVDTIQIENVSRTLDFKEASLHATRTPRTPIASRNRFKSNSIKNPIGSLE